MDAKVQPPGREGGAQRNRRHITGIGRISGVCCMVAVNDSGISAGAMQSLTGQKLMRAQDIALAQRLPLVQLVESAGGNLRKPCIP